MILSRRKVHFYAVVGLSCALPLVFLAGLIWRPVIPTVDESTDDLFAAAGFAERRNTVDATLPETLSVQGVDINIQVASGPEGSQFLLLEPLQALRFSDVLVYWVPGETPPEGVPEEARLLGWLSGTSQRRLLVSPAMQQQPGQLLFYSRGQSTAIAAVPFPLGLLP